MQKYRNAAVKKSLSREMKKSQMKEISILSSNICKCKNHKESCNFKNNLGLRYIDIINVKDSINSNNFQNFSIIVINNFLTNIRLTRDGPDIDHLEISKLIPIYLKKSSFLC